MPFTTKIQALINAHTNTSLSSEQTAIDWKNNFFYQNGPGTGVFPSNFYLTKIDLTTGIELVFKDLSTYSPAAYDGVPIGFDATGIYLDVPTLNILKADSSSLAQILNTNIGFVVSNGTISPITNTSGDAFLLLTAAGQVATFAEVYTCVKCSDFSAWSPGVLNYNAWTALSCPGPFGSGFGYVIAAYNNSNGGFQLIKVNVNAGLEGATIVASHPPTDIDATFTQLICVGVCLDQTDGNPLVLFTGSPSGAHPSYMVKVSAATGAILWKLGLALNSSFPQGQMQQSLIKAQQFVVVYDTGGGVNNGLVIDTGSGTLTDTITAGLGGIGPNEGQCFNDQTGAIIQQFDLSPNIDGPQLLNSTPSSFRGWGVLYIIPPKPAFSAILGSGYFIERMDNREWPAVENVWCVDCALQTTLPTFNATLTASSATGAGIPTGVTNLFGGQGYSAATTATILDPTGTGASVGLTIASGIITGITIAGGTNYTYPELVFNDPAQTGQGASADVTLDNSAIFQASAASFNSGMVGDVIRMGGGVATITAYTNSQQVTANITTPIAQVLPNSGGIPIPQSAGDWSIATPISTVYGLMHLAGFTVTGVADGAVVTPRVVAPDGSVTLDNPATLITLGLPFTPQFQSLYLDGGSPTIQGQRKKVAAVTVRLDASGVTGIQAGSNQPTGSAQSPQVQDVPWDDLDGLQTRPDQAAPPYGSTTPPLFTGDTRAALKGGVDRPGQVALQQTLPLPMNVTAIIPEGLEGDQPEQGYQPKQEREPHRPSPKGGGRGR